MVTAQLTPTRVGIHNVLIATDFSVGSTHAVEFGLKLAKTHGASANIVFVVPADPFLLVGPEAYVAAKEAARRDLHGLEVDLRTTYGYKAREDYQLHLLEGGDIAEAILAFARRNHTDLVVIGTHGRGGLGKALLGSVAERVFRGSPVPVLTIGPHSRFSDALMPKKILAPVDFTPASQRAAEYAAGVARENGSQLTLLHVIAARELEHIPDRDRVLRDMENKLATFITDYGAAPRLRVEIGRIVPAILDVADEIRADLLVVGVRPSVGLLERFMWPHAYEIVRESSCPVLTVR